MDTTTNTQKEQLQIYKRTNPNTQKNKYEKEQTHNRANRTAQYNK